MTERVTSSLERWGTAIIVFCSIGTCVCLVGFAVLVIRSVQQSSEGAKARARQIRVMPVSCKEHEDAWRRRVITRVELVDVWGCPAPHAP